MTKKTTGSGANPVEARYYDRLPDKKIRCRLCPHECRVADLERGSCGVRENRDGTYYTLVYGNPCSMNVDPIEKKPMFHFHPGETAFSLATAGCNFVCRFCQNWEISQKRPEQVKSVPLSPDQAIDAALRSGCRVVAHTYTEPVVFYEYMLACAEAGKKRGVTNIMISNGFIQKDPMIELCRHLGAVKIDLKAFTDKFYREQCAGRLQPVLDTLVLICRQKVWLEIVVLVIPTLNDSDKEIEQMSDWIVKELGPDVPLHFSRFHPTFQIRNIPPTPPQTLMQARKIAMDRGVKFVYVGNLISDAEHTYCPHCGKTVISRVMYSIDKSGLAGNRCRHCQTIIPGVFS